MVCWGRLTSWQEVIVRLIGRHVQRRSPRVRKYAEHSHSRRRTNEKDYLLHRRLGARGEGIGQTALATVLAIIVEGHEDTSTALRGRAFTTKALDLAVGLDLVVLQNGHLNLLTLVLNLLRGL